MTSFGAGSQSRGYGRIQLSRGGTPSGVAIISFQQNNILVSEAGVPASPPIQNGRVYAEVNRRVNTGLAIANPNNQAAIISFFFTDQNGANFGSGTTTIPPNGQLAKFLDEPPFNGGSSVSGTFTFNSNQPVAVVALRGLINERSEFLMTTLPVSPVSAAGAATGTGPGAAGEMGFFPQFADGAGWTTQLVLVNPTDEVLTGTVAFWVAGESGSPFSYTIPPRSSRRIQTLGEGTGVQVGSIRVHPASNNKMPSGLTIFSLKNGDGVTVSEAGVPSARFGSNAAFRVYAEASGGFGQDGSIQTGVAIANNSGNSAVINFELPTLEGTATGLTGTYTLPGNGQVSLFLNEIPGFGSLQTPFQGVLRISTTAQSGISVVGLRGRYNQRGDYLFTTIPAVDEAAPHTAAELIFPHVVDGGGYTTQFVLFSGTAGQSSSGILRVFSQNGQRLTLSFR
jgi:hypothetical protein